LDQSGITRARNGPRSARCRPRPGSCRSALRSSPGRPCPGSPRSAGSAEGHVDPKNRFTSAEAASLDLPRRRGRSAPGLLPTLEDDLEAQMRWSSRTMNATRWTSCGCGSRRSANCRPKSSRSSKKRSAATRWWDWTTAPGDDRPARQGPARLDRRAPGVKPPSQNGATVSRRVLRRLQAIDGLPKRDQDALFRTIDAFLNRGRPADRGASEAQLDLWIFARARSASLRTHGFGWPRKRSMAGFAALALSLPRATTA